MAKNTLITTIIPLLRRYGYSIQENSVNNKNQTRFIHFLLKKAGNHYFAKINLRSTNLIHLQNEVLSDYLQSGKGFTFVKPLEKIVVDDNHILYIFPFIKHPALSDEHDDFKKFYLSPSEHNDFYDAVFESLQSISGQTLYTYKDMSRSLTQPQDTLLRWLGAVDPTEEIVISALQRINPTLIKKTPLVPAIVDIQPQNLLWDKAKKHLYIIDLESMQSMPTSYDHAKLASSIFTVCNQPELALGWIRYYLRKTKSSKQADKLQAIGSLYMMLLWTGVEYYVYYKQKNDSSREALAIKFLRWCLYDFMDAANEKA